MESTKDEKINLIGSSILVPSVQELAKQSLISIPPQYERLDQDDPRVKGSSLLSVPVIDFEKLVAGDADSMDSELDKLHFACKEWGFFQVVNHGVSTMLLERLEMEIEKLFKLPYEEKKKLWQKPGDIQGFGQYFVVSMDQKLDWSDMFGLFTLPISLRNDALFYQLSPNLRETIETYSCETTRLSMEILSKMGKALKMNPEEIEELFNDGFQTMRMNYYPPCPEPEKAIGFTPHSDVDALTILYQLNQTDGLQIKKDGNWVPIKPLPHTFVVNVGDIMEIVSNGVYKSIEHRATVNSTKERLSIGSFYSSNLESVVGPSTNATGPHNPPIFRRLLTSKYLQECLVRKLDGKSFLDFMKISAH